MDPNLQEPKPIINGVPTKMICHISHRDGLGSMCHTHYHTYIEVLYCVSGNMEVWLNNHHYHFLQGDMLVINSNEIHTIEAVSEGSNDYLVLRFEPELLYDTTQDVFELKYILPFLLNSGTPQKLFAHRDIFETEIPRLIWDSIREYERKDYGYELAIRSNLCRIFVWILRYWNQNGIDLSGIGPVNSELLGKLQPAIDYLHKNYAREISVYEMASLCHLSYSYFSRSFKKLMQRSFNDYLNYIRITEAEKLLITTDLNITEIAFRVGFTSTSYFIRIFNEYKCTSPTKFRKNFVKDTGINLQ